MRKIFIICLIFLMVLSLWATSRPQKNIASIKSAYIINRQIKDTTLVVFSYKGNKIVKRYYKSNRAKNR